MNRLMLLLVIAITIGLAHDGVVVTQSNPIKISLSVSLPQLVVSSEQRAMSGMFSELYFDGADISTEIGAPQLPVIRELVEIPFDAAVEVNVNISESERIHLTNPVLPLQPSIPKSGPAPEFTISQKIYNTDDYLLKERVRIEEIGEIRGHRFALVEIYPVAYNPKQNLVEYASNMSIELNLNGSNIDKTIQMRNDYYSKPYDMLMSNLLKNYDAYALNPPPDLPIGYLIIVPDEWVNNIAPLVEWRTRRGFSVFVRTLSQIGGGTNSIVLNAIINAYNTWPIRPTFVLLVGDVDKIGYFVGQGQATPPTDLNYSTIAGTDYLPDLDLSRASVVNAAQLDSLVWKTIKYEKNQWLSGTEWTKKALFIASADGSYHGVAEGTHRYCMAKVRSYGMIADSIFTYYQSGAAAMVTTRVNEGRAWLTFSGHGGETGWADPGISYPTSTVHALTNVDKVPLVGSYCCLSGNFAYSQECFSESWIRSGLRGAITNYASSVSSYWPNDDTLQRRVFDAAFDSSFYWAMGMLNKGKLRYFLQWGNSSMTRMYFEMYNMIGDGAIDVYSDIPAALTVTYPNVIPLGMYNIPVTVTKSGMPVRNALVCAMVKSDTSRRAMAYTDISGQVSLSLTTIAPDSVYITVTGHNLAPHLGGTMALATSGAYVMHIRNQIFDPTPGGNNNGIVNPSEAVEMRAWFKNFGSSIANNVRVWLRTADNNITITDSFKNLGNIASNDSAYTTDGFNFSIAANCTNNYRLQFSLTIKDATDSTWVSNITIPVAQCVLEHVSTSVDDAAGNNNGIINRGETVNLIATIRNIGGDNATNVMSVLSSTTAGISVLDANGNFGTIAPTTTASNTADPYTISADSSIVPGTIANFRIVVTSGVYIETLYFSLPIEIYLQGFEANNGSFEPVPTTGAWEWGVPTSGPGSAHSGAKLWATVLAGNYGIDYANWTLTSPEFTATGDNPTLKFWHWYSFEGTSTLYDCGNVKISTNNGGTWNVVTPVGGYTGTGYSSTPGVGGQPVYGGSSNGWVEAVFNLPVTAGQTFKIRWHFGSDGSSSSYPGWYIDDVTGIGFAVLPPPNNDVGVEAIRTPGSSHIVNTSMIPSAVIKNYGVLVQNNIPVVCSIIGAGNAVRYTNTQVISALSAGDTARVNFISWLPTISENVSIVMKTNLVGDQNALNDRKSIVTMIGNIMLENFEASSGGYIADPASSAWAWGTPTSGPNGAYSPVKCWATVLGGNYASSANWKLTSTSFVASVNNSVLKFMHWYQFEGLSTRFDGGNVKISVASGPWTVISPVGGYIGVAASANVAIPGESCYSSTTTGNFWSEAVFNLPVTIGQQFQIRWHFGSDGTVTYPGWYVDDVMLIGAGLSTIAEQEPNRLTITTLYAPKPNPVTNGIARISYSLSELTKVKLTIYDASGRIVKTLVNTQMESGIYNLTWNGRDANNRAVAEGIYFYTLETPKQNFTKKLIFTR